MSVEQIKQQVRTMLDGLEAANGGRRMVTSQMVGFALANRIKSTGLGALGTRDEIVSVAYEMIESHWTGEHQCDQYVIGMFLFSHLNWIGEGKQAG